jgi:hypothetical protein
MQQVYQGENYNAKAEITVFDQLTASFTNNLDVAHSTVTSIEDRVHRLLDRRMPEPPTQGGQLPIQQPPNDVYQLLASQVYRAEALNQRLEKLLKHLSEIV